MGKRESLGPGFESQRAHCLLHSKRNGVTNADVTLDAIGNITWKMGIGSYTYHATKKRAVIQAGSHPYGYDANGNLTSRDGSTISYTSYNLPSGINAGSNSSTLSYGAFRNRSKQVAVTAGITETTIYVGGLLEKVTRGSITEYRHRIEGGAGLAALYIRRSSGSPLTDTYYVHQDHLGSPELMTNSSGASVIKLSFGAYGERRDSDWDGQVSSGDMTTIGNTSRMGFTGHEHLDAVGLIHMNGRVYDPLIGRFLSRDPLIAADGSGQAPNGYAYVRNNPLARIDPSGLSDFEPKQPFSGARSCVEKGLDCDLLGAAGQAGGTDSPIPITPFDPINIVGARNDTLWASFNAEIGIELRSSETGFAAGGVLPIQDASKNDGDVNPSRMTCTTRLPDSRTVAENVNQMRSRAEELLSNPFTAEGAYAVLISEWMTKVAPGGGWDYKLMQGGTDEMGNFNYGATGSLLLPAGLLVRIGGSDQIVQHLIDAERHPYSGDWGTPLDPLPRVGDDPDDTKAILAGADGCR